MATTIRIRSLFHGTETTCLINDSRMPADESEVHAGNLDAMLTAKQKRRVHRALCGQGTWTWPTCACSSRGGGMKVEIVR